MPENLEFYPNLAAAIQSGKYQWVAFDEGGNGEIDYYALLEVAYCANIVAPKYQYMNIFIPANYLNVDENGEITGVNWESKIGQYIPATPPATSSPNSSWPCSRTWRRSMSDTSTA